VEFSLTAFQQLSEQLAPHKQAHQLDVPDVLRRFQAFYEVLLVANQTMNLTRITDANAFAYKHLWDSMTLLPFLPEPSDQPLSLLDVGTGGGMPGVPLWLARPDMQVFLMDSVNKKLKAIMHMSEQLQQQFPVLTTLPTPLHMRAEDAGQHKDHRETYQVVVSRAVASLPVLLEYCLPLVARRGLFIAMKGPGYQSEMQHIQQIAGLMGGRLREPVVLTTPEGEERVLLIFEKRSLTPKTLPRPAGEAKKRPLTAFVSE
jgi:16S rRNA (guanine527-N7)-methyltransferase